MKKFIKVVVTVVVIAVISIMAKNTVVANAEAVDKEEKAIVVINNTREDAAVEGTTKETTNDVVTFRLMVDRIEYLSFRKGHDGEYTLEYSVNNGPKHKVIMGVLGLEMFNYVPTYVSHFYDIENVKMGDVITYTYSYYNTYFQEKEPCVVKGTQVVNKALDPSEYE